ncbi:low molecular weight protein-tyrosine-phosphatase [Fibrobacter sp.]|uniref:low molecular weight protein-tyrosine-phosphatase n=1 Tax=Fibrobacter sp. TaxID=35828 RepID=UPI00389080BE
MVKILFVCHGNICRSPMAEFVMKKLVAKELGCKSTPSDNGVLHAENFGEKLPCEFDARDFEIASAATSTEEIGNPVYPPARRMLAAHGIDCSGKYARQVTAHDLAYYDYIVLMDQNNLRNMRRMFGADKITQKISLLMEWAGSSRDVADPWYTGNFEATWSDVNEGCRALLKTILEGQ